MLAVGLSRGGLKEWCLERMVPRSSVRGWLAFVDGLVHEIETSVGENMRERGPVDLDQLLPLCPAAGLDVSPGLVAVWRHCHAPVEHLEAVRGRELRAAG
eukprot:13783758-Alexandrium_andersonii.AAC.1